MAPYGERSLLGGTQRRYRWYQGHQLRIEIVAPRTSNILGQPRAASLGPVAASCSTQKAPGDPVQTVGMESEKNGYGSSFQRLSNDEDRAMRQEEI